MINPQLLEYVQQQLATGISKEEISKALVTNGWQVTDINDVFAMTSSMPTTQLPVQAPSLNFMQPAAVSAGTSHAGMWVIVIVLLLLVGAGGAFAAYQAGLFTTSPTAPVANNETSTTSVLPVAGTTVEASSTNQTTPSATSVVATSTKVVSSVKTTSSNLKENTLGTPSNIQLNASTKPATTSKSGTTTEDPSYIVTTFTTTSPVNTLRFNWKFAEAGEGYLRIAVDDEIVRTIDQRFAPTGVTTQEEVYIGGNSGFLAPGEHKLVIRLDGFGANPSGVLLTDVSLWLNVTTTSPQ